MKYTILIPAYQPDEKVLNTADRLNEMLLCYPDSRMIIVDDGSGEAYRDIFVQLAHMGCTVITCRENRGKGAAIKAGISFAEKYFPGSDYVITADCDGQHRPEDIEKLMRAAAFHTGKNAPLILGTRDFSGPDVPKKSRYGNAVSSFYFLLATGKKCPDTQTGLRAVPSCLFALAEETEGERYEYEMNFLLAAAKTVPLQYVKIDTVYENDNRGSHFRPVADSLRIFRTPIRYAASSLLSSAADLILFTVLAAYAGTGAGGILLATAGARLVSGGLNFTLNRKWSFRSQGSDRGPAAGQGIRYLILFFGILFASWFFVEAFSILPIPLTAVKILVDVDLAVASYYLQQKWVFRERSGVRCCEAA